MQTQHAQFAEENRRCHNANSEGTHNGNHSVARASQTNTTPHDGAGLSTQGHNNKLRHT